MVTSAIPFEFADKVLLQLVVVVAAAAAAAAAVVVVVDKVLSHPTMGGVILRLGALPEPWESENTSEDLRRS